MIRKWHTTRISLVARLLASASLHNCLRSAARVLQPSLSAVDANVNINNLSSAQLSRDRSNQSCAPFLG